MSKITYVLGRLQKMDYAQLWAVIDQIAKASSHSRFRIAQDMFYCALKYNAGYVDYRIAQMYRLNNEQRGSVITRGINNKLVRSLNDKSYWHCFDDKDEFNRLFAQWVSRDWIRLSSTLTPDTLRRFLEGRESVFFKPLTGSSGQGIRKFTRKDWNDPDAFHRTLQSMGDALLEDCIEQHPKMAELFPGSVNTTRIATILGTKAEGVVYAFVRIGNGKVVDNVDTGGMAARVDLETGRLMTPAADKQGNVFKRHPITGIPIPGFELPFFKEAVEMCLQAMRVVPQVRYVAWDVAMTARGPTLIEGNSFPSHAVPQFAAHYPDGIGILPEFQKYVDL